MRVGQISVTELCRQQKVSRKTAYKWVKRYRLRGLGGLSDQSRRPHRIFGRPGDLWLKRLKEKRRRRPSWGARKLHHCLGEDFGPLGLPSVAAISRWLKRWQMVHGGRRRKPGPTVLRRPVRRARHSNDVWTVDFKGWYRTGDGTRVEALTVRDLYSRYGLKVALQRSQAMWETRRQFVKIFKQYGLPKRIRSDNGTPFGGAGPTGLTRLSAWWVKLGIEVEFITPGRPQENGAHEQLHRVYKKEVAKHPARTFRGQQRKSTRWLRRYNEERPHEGLKMATPARYYRPSLKRLPGRLLPWTYPVGWERRWVKGNGEISGRENGDSLAKRLWEITLV